MFDKNLVHVKTICSSKRNTMRNRPIYKTSNKLNELYHNTIAHASIICYIYVTLNKQNNISVMYIVVKYASCVTSKI